MQESHEARIVRLETQMENIEGWMKSISEKLDRHLDYHKPPNSRSYYNGNSNGNITITISKRWITFAIVVGAVIGSVIFTLASKFGVTI
jgi:hypothetical protein